MVLWKDLGFVGFFNSEGFHGLGLGAESRFFANITKNVAATVGTEKGNTNRRVRSHVSGDTGGVSYLTVEFVLEDAVGGCGFANVARPAGEH